MTATWPDRIAAGESQTLEFKASFEKYGSGFIRIRSALQEYPEIQFDIADNFSGVIAMFSRKIELSRISQVRGVINRSVKNTACWLKRLKDQSQIEFRDALKSGDYHHKNL
jgi:hypothetical protein